MFSPSTSRSGSFLRRLIFHADDPSLSSVELSRREYRRTQDLHSAGISIISTLLLVTFIVVGLNLSPGWPRVRDTFFSPKYFVQSFPDVLRGLAVNGKVLVFSVVGVAVFGTLLAMIRTSTSSVLFPLRVITQIFTTLMRGIPMLVVLYLIGFGIPGLGIFGRIPAVLLGTISIILCYSTYVSEVLRAGFEDVSPSQRASARSLGLTAGQTIRLVVIPQALRSVAPALVNDFIGMQKDAGLISVLGAIDAVRAAQVQVAQTYNFTPYVVASILFILTSVPFIVLNDWYSRRLRHREQNGGTV